MAPTIPNPLATWFEGVLDQAVRPRFFKKMDFAEPAGDPGWFGPDSPIWYVHSHMPAMFFGLTVAAMLESLDPSIAWMGYDHSRIVERVDGVPTGRVDPDGAAVRFAHSLAFFIATAYGPTETAERAARAVRAMHHTIKGTRPDGVPYDADSPEWLRWNYATVVYGIGAAHQRYHHSPLRGDDLARYYREFTRVGEALGGTDLPATEGEVHECLEAAVPILGVSAIAAARTGPNLLADVPLARRPLVALLDWAQQDLQPGWAKKMLLHKTPPMPVRLARRQTVWTLLNGLHLTTGPIREFRQSQARAAAAPLAPMVASTAPTEPDAPMARAEVEAAV